MKVLEQPSRPWRDASQAGTGAAVRLALSVLLGLFCLSGLGCDNPPQPPSGPGTGSQSPSQEDPPSQVDPPPVSSSCSEKEGQPCYGGPSGTQGVGICRGGTLQCNPSGILICQGQQLPRWEVCWTQEDENCDGVRETCERGEPGWTSTGAMASPRVSSTATLLPNGQVLVSGGYRRDNDSFTTAEVYDPAPGTWSATGTMRSPRYSHTATLLPDGKVLVSGGSPRSGSDPLKTAEVYDLATGTWSATGGLATPIGRPHD